MSKMGSPWTSRIADCVLMGTDDVGEAATPAAIVAPLVAMCSPNINTRHQTLQELGTGCE